MVSRLSLPLLLIALLVLGGLQYRWIGQISEAERQRLEREVHESADEVVEDFTSEIRGLSGTLEGRAGSSREPSAIVLRYREWAEASGYPNLLRNLYLFRATGEFSRIDLTNGNLRPTLWPAELAPLEGPLTRRIPGPGPRLAVETLVFPVTSSDGPRRDRGREFFGDWGGRGERGDRDRGGERGGERGFEPRGPQGNRGGGWPGAWGPPVESWVIAELSREEIVREIFPTLVARRFPDYEGREYRIAVVSKAEDRVIFTNGPSWTPEDLSTPDRVVDFAGIRGPGPRRGGGGEGGGGRGRGPVPLPQFVGQDWQLLVQHEAGSLELAANRLRTRNLAISFGILIVLGIGAMTVVISGQRARHLGQVQMEFAAGVSHELRTPLTVIQSAAHNLRAGIVRDREGIEEYAAIVQKEARRLSEMVEHVMAYTETQSGRKRYDIGPIDISDVTENALRNTAMVLLEGNVTVQKNLDPAAPPVMGDASALTRCIQNLVSNAVKYGRTGDSAEIEIRTSFEPASGRVQLSVIDGGLGVPEADVPHLFEAFHRGTNASTNTPGNGLGLHLVHKMMEAQNGFVTYEQAPGGGAKFTLTLRAAGQGA